MGRYNKLTDDEVRAICAQDLTCHSVRKAVAEIYKISGRYVRYLRDGKKRKPIAEPAKVSREITAQADNEGAP